MKVRRRSTSLRSQIFVRTLVVGLIPLTLLATAAVLGLADLEATANEGIEETRRSLATETVNSHLRSEAEATGREIDLLLAERVNDVIGFARQPAVIAGSEAGGGIAVANELVGLSVEEAESRFAGSPSLGAAPGAEAYLIGELERQGAFIDVSFTDRHGFNAGIVGTPQDFVQSDEEWWQHAWNEGLHIGAVAIHPEAQRFVVPIASRIENADGTAVGVLRASLGVDFVQSIADARASDDLSISVITGDRLLLAETATDHEASRMGVADLTDAELPPGAVDALGVETGTAMSEEAVHGFTTVGWSRLSTAADTGVVDQADWHIVASRSEASAFAPVASLGDLSRELDAAEFRLSAATVAVLILSCLACAVGAHILTKKIVTPVRVLTGRVQRAAQRELPAVVARLQDPASDLTVLDEPALDIDAGNELDELAASFNSVHRTAIRMAAEQARQRRMTAEMFANLGRRNQSLVKRQLRFIEDLEQSEEDPDRLASLFKLDHLATRMRRNAESLLVIAGHRSSNLRSAAVRIELVTQAALGEVENFDRADITAVQPAALVGRIVTDVAHVLAELIENALSFSPPEAPVEVTGERGLTHYTMSVVDRGIGMSDDELDQINERLASDSGVELTSSKQLGLFVVAKLADRHGLKVRLATPAAGGIVATVEIPNALVTSADAAPAARPASPPQAPKAEPEPTPTPTPTESTATPQAPPEPEPEREPEPEPEETPEPVSVETPTAEAPTPEPADTGHRRRKTDVGFGTARREPAAAPLDVPSSDPVDPVAAALAAALAPAEPADRVPSPDTPPATSEAATPDSEPVGTLAFHMPAEVDTGSDDATEPPTPASAESAAAHDEPSGETPERRRYIGSLSSTSESAISQINRRESRRPGRGQQRTPTAAKEKRSVATTVSDNEVVEEAAQIRNRWNSFRSAQKRASEHGVGGSDGDESPS